jgi:zinc protease
MPDAVELERVYIAAVVPAFGERDWYAADLLATALSSGKSSPLYRDLVYERQIATDVSAFVLPTELCATFAIVATARPGAGSAELAAIIYDHLDGVTSGEIDETDLERARNKVITALTDQFQKLDDRADLLSMFTTFFDDPDRIHHEAAIYADLRREELSELAVRYLARDGLVELTVVPREGG